MYAFVEITLKLLQIKLSNKTAINFVLLYQWDHGETKCGQARQERTPPWEAAFFPSWVQSTWSPCQHCTRNKTQSMFQQSWWLKLFIWKFWSPTLLQSGSCCRRWPFVPCWKNSFLKKCILIWKGGVYKDTFIWCCFVSEDLIFLICQTSNERDHEEQADRLPLVLLIKVHKPL